MAFRLALAFLALAAFGLPILSIISMVLTFSAFFDRIVWLVTVCFYGATASAGWGLGFGNLGKSLIGTSVACLALAFGVPAGLNAFTKSEIAGLSASDTESLPTIPPDPKVIAILSPMRSERGRNLYDEKACELFCQRLLYGGHRRAVLMGATPPSGLPEDASELVRYSIEDRESCPPTDLSLTTGLSNETMMWGAHPTSDAVSILIANGHCLVEQQGSISEADVAGVWSSSNQATWQSVRNNSGAVGSGREEVFVKRNGEWESLARQSRGLGSAVSMPFHLDGSVSKYRIAREDLLLASGERQPQSLDIFMNSMRKWMPKPR